MTIIRQDVPQDPKWGIKKNSEGKNIFWYGDKVHLVVGTSSQYILQSLFSGGQLNDGKAAIPLFKGLQERLSLPHLRATKPWMPATTMNRFTTKSIGWVNNL